jgi:hypothetical protein
MPEAPSTFSFRRIGHVPSSPYLPPQGAPVTHTTLLFHFFDSCWLQDNPELLEPVNFDRIRLVTAQMHQQIANGTFDAPSWGLIRAAKMATPIYSPLGTAMSLGDYVRVTRAFLEVFKAGHLPDPNTYGMEFPDPEVNAQLEDENVVKLKEDLQVSTSHRYFDPFFLLQTTTSAARHTSQNYTGCELEMTASAAHCRVRSLYIA